MVLVRAYRSHAFLASYLNGNLHNSNSDSHTCVTTNFSLPFWCTTNLKNSKIYIYSVMLYIHHVTSHEHHGISDHWLLDCLLNSLFRFALKKTSSLALCKGIHKWLVDSSHSGAVMQKAFPSHEIILMHFEICFFQECESQNLPNLSSEGLRQRRHMGINGEARWDGNDIRNKGLSHGTCRSHGSQGIVNWGQGELNGMAGVGGWGGIHVCRGEHAR